MDLPRRRFSRLRPHFNWKIFSTANKSRRPGKEKLDERELVSRFTALAKSVRLTQQPLLYIAHLLQFLRIKPSRARRRESEPSVEESVSQHT
jgi:hypothetical protein